MPPLLEEIRMVRRDLQGNRKKIVPSKSSSSSSSSTGIRWVILFLVKGVLFPVAVLLIVGKNWLLLRIKGASNTPMTQEKRDQAGRFYQKNIEKSLFTQNHETALGLLYSLARTCPLDYRDYILDCVENRFDEAFITTRWLVVPFTRSAYQQALRAAPDRETKSAIQSILEDL